MSSHRNSSRGAASPAGRITGLLIAVIVLVVIAFESSRSGREPPVQGPAGSVPTVHKTVTNPIERSLTSPANVQRREGIAVAVLIDTSGSMGEKVSDADGQPRPKMEIARRAVLDLLRQCDRFARENPARNVRVGVYEFSARESGPSCRTVIAVSPPNLAAAESAVRRMTPSGGTPIGDALILAKRDLDAAGLSHMHLLVVSDGENNIGYSPQDVVSVISRLPEEHRAAVYFIAFDIAGEKFKAVRDAGGMVLAAANETELRQTLDYVLSGKILAEQPEAPRGK